MTPTLYSMPSSGNSYKVRLLLSFIGQEYRHIGLEADSPDLAAAHAAKTFPLGKMPVLVLEDGTEIPESNAILYYLSDGSDWLPDDPVTRAKVLAWMFWEQNQHEGVIAVRAALLKYPSRAHLATPERMAELLETGQRLLETMDRHLSGTQWFVGTQPTVADVSLYAYTHTADTFGGFDLSDFVSLRDWIDRMASLPGYVGLDDIPK